MTKWVECVPNFSEGCDAVIIDRIAETIRTTKGARLLHVDPGPDANRTVITYVASPEAAVEAGFRAIAKASELIDMSRQKGVHKRLGATDVFPFIPIQNTTFEECGALAGTLASRVSNELGIPVFLYGHAATRPDRVRVPDIRKGGYEALAKKIHLPEYKPDFGAAIFSPKHGATIIGVRDFLVAYNVNLNTASVDAARTIARRLRQSGVPKRDNRGRLVKNGDGSVQRIPGRLPAVQADGWLMPTYGLAQVTMNLMDFRKTGLHTAYEAVREEALALGFNVRGSELIGLVPKEALLAAGRYFASMGSLETPDETALIAIAVEKLGLSIIRPFVLEQRVLEVAMSAQPPTP